MRWVELMCGGALLSFSTQSKRKGNMHVLASIPQKTKRIIYNSAELHMTYSLVGMRAGEVRFAYRKLGDTAWGFTPWVAKTADGSHTEIILDVASDTDYEYKAQLRLNKAVTEGKTRRFRVCHTILPLLPQRVPSS